MASFQGFVSFFIFGFAGFCSTIKGLFFSGPTVGPDDVFYGFKVGLNGASLNGSEGLKDAGGNLPFIRTFDNHGSWLGSSLARVDCEQGSDRCGMVVKDIKQQPSYALLRGRPDAICLAAVTVRFQAGDQYIWFGNWARTCNKPWYYSDIDVQSDNGTHKLLCSWLGEDGFRTEHRTGGYPTGIRIHFPEFATGSEASKQGPDYFCKADNNALQFSHEPYPWYFDGTSGKQMEKIDNVEKSFKKLLGPKGRFRAADVAEMEAVTDEALNEAVDEEQPKRMGNKGIGMETRSIVSYDAKHSAVELCGSETSFGPSLVSETERSFCYMPEKKLYRFCGDVESGACWDAQAHAFDAVGPNAIQARAALPNVQFDQPMIWGLSGIGSS